MIETFYAINKRIADPATKDDTLVYALVFVAAVGLGPFPGVLAVIAYTTTSLAKLYSEAIEGIDPGPTEAITATGANAVQVTWAAVLPQIVIPFIAFTIYRLDTNVRLAPIVGLVGGGGIGQMLFERAGLFRYGDVGVIIGDNRFTCQEACEIGFRSYLREQMSGQRVLEPVRSLEDAETARRVTRELLANHPELAALYAPSGGVEGIIQALRESGRQRDITLVCHGPVQGGEMALLDGTVDLLLCHRIPELAATIVETLLAADEQPGLRHIINRFDVITKENL